MKYILLLLLGALFSCTPKTTPSANELPLQGTWRLLKGIVVDGKDTTITDYTKNYSFIKIINADHFAFLEHDFGPDSTTFVAGGGPYTLQDSLYTEQLEYCSDQRWENNSFAFTVRIANDTLVQTGVETVAAAGVNRLNREIYARVK